MPTYEVTDNTTGKKYRLEGDSPPTEQELNQIFAQQRGAVSAPATNPDKAYFESLNPLEKARIGIGKGMMDLVTGVKQLGAKVGNMAGVVDDSTVQNLINQGKADEALYKGYAGDSTAAKVGEFIGQTAPTIALPGGVAGSIAKRMGTAALTGAGIGAIQPTQDTGIGANLQNAGIGGLLAGGTTAALSGASKLINGIRGNVPQNEIDALSQKWNIPATLGEVTGKPGTQRTEVLLERVPGIGLGGYRKQQLEAASTAAKQFFGKYVADPTAIEGTTAEMKIANDTALDGLYQKLRQMTKGIPSGDAEATKNISAGILDRYPTVFEGIQDNHVKRILKNIVGDTTDKTIDTGILDASGRGINRTEKPQFSFNDLWELRKGIGKEIGDARTDTARGQLNAIYSAVSDDIDKLLGSSDNAALSAFKQANDSFKKYSVKFDLLRAAYDKAMGTVGANEMFSPKTFSTALKGLANGKNAGRNFNPTEIKEMTGLANIMQVVKRAGQYKENPATGNRWGALLGAGGLEGAAYLAGGASVAAQAGGAGLAAAGIARFLTSTQAGKNLARASSKIDPSSPAMKIIVDQIYNQVPKWAATEGLDLTQSQGGIE